MHSSSSLGLSPCLSSSMYDRNAVAKILAETDKHLMEIGRSPPRSMSSRDLPTSLFGGTAASKMPFVEVHRSYTRRHSIDSPRSASAPGNATYDVASAMLRQQEAIDGLIHELHRIKEAQYAATRGASNETENAVVALERRVASEVAMIRTEMDSVKNECRRQSIRIDGFVERDRSPCTADAWRQRGSGDGDSVTREQLSTVDRALRVRLETIEKALNAKLDGFHESVEKSMLMRLSEVEKRLEGISPRMGSSIECVEDSMARLRKVISSQSEAIERLQRKVDSGGVRHIVPGNAGEMKAVVEALEKESAQQRAKIDEISSNLAAITDDINTRDGRLEEVETHLRKVLTEKERSGKVGTTGEDLERRFAGLQRSIEQMRASTTAERSSRVADLEEKVDGLADRLREAEARLSRDSKKVDELWRNRGREDVIAMIEESLVQDREKLGELWQRYTEEDGWEERIERRVDKLEFDEKALVDRVKGVTSGEGIVGEMKVLKGIIERVKEEVKELRGQSEKLVKKMDRLEEWQKENAVDKKVDVATTRKMNKSDEIDSVKAQSEIQVNQRPNAAPLGDESVMAPPSTTIQLQRVVDKEEAPVSKDADVAPKEKKEGVTATVSRESVDRGQSAERSLLPVGRAQEKHANFIEESPTSASPATPAVPRWSRGDELSGLSSDLDLSRGNFDTNDAMDFSKPLRDSKAAKASSSGVVESSRGSDDRDVSSAGNSDVKSRIVVNLGTDVASQKRPDEHHLRGSHNPTKSAQPTPSSSHLELMAQRDLLSPKQEGDEESIPEECPTPPSEGSEDDTIIVQPTGTALTTVEVEATLEREESYDDWDDDDEVEFD